MSSGIVLGFLFRSLCLCRHTACPSCPASPREPTLLDKPPDSGPGGGGKSEQEQRPAGVFAPRTSSLRGCCTWYGRCLHLHPELLWERGCLWGPEPATSASPSGPRGPMISPIPVCGSSLTPLQSPLPVSMTSPSMSARGIRLITFTPAPPSLPRSLHSKRHVSVQGRETRRRTSWREVGIQ